MQLDMILHHVTRDPESLLFECSQDYYSTIGPSAPHVVKFGAEVWRGNCVDHLTVEWVKGATFKNTRKFPYEMIPMLASTCGCEQLFSVMKGNKSPVRNSIHDAHLESVLNVITVRKISPEIGKRVAEKKCQVSGCKQ
ncbi:general transcription factor II-I repeat domain-containing protein 2 [Trichonephila clavipes]|nr:general transcription factor II-I repeat domain-containing protein 2 [Trichonephila clavipes]